MQILLLRYLPNFITGIRLLLTGPIVWSLLTSHRTITLYLFGIAAITDWLDGWLARKYMGWQSELGAFLDPLADKVLLISTLVTCSYLSILPVWVVAVSVSRDIGIILGILIYRVWIGSLKYQAILSSKLNTALQLSLIMLLLIQQFLPDFPNIILQGVSLAMVTTSIISFVQYTGLWISKVRHHVNTTR
jgi:cardiolipin synthase